MSVAHVRLAVTNSCDHFMQLQMPPPRATTRSTGSTPDPSMRQLEEVFLSPAPPGATPLLAHAGEGSPVAAVPMSAPRATIAPALAGGSGSPVVTEVLPVATPVAQVLAEAARGDTVRLTDVSSMVSDILQGTSPDMVTHFLTHRYVLDSQLTRLSFAFQGHADNNVRVAAMQRTVGHLQAQLDHLQAKYTGLQDSHAELQLKQDDLQVALERLADLTGTADTWGIRAASFGMRLDQPCFHGLVILFSGLSAQVFAIPFLPAVDTIQYGPQGTITDWPILDQDLNRVDPEYLNSLPQAPHLAPTKRWELEKYYDYLDAVHTEGGNRQRLARIRAGVRIPTQFIPGVPLGDIPYVRVGLKRGTIVKVIWPTLAFAPNLTHTGTGQEAAGVGQAPPGALAVYLTAAAAPPPSPQGGWNLPPALPPTAQAAALVPAHPNPRLGGGGAEGAVTRSGVGPSTSAGRELTTDVRLEPPKVRRVDFNSPGGGQDLFRMFQDAPLSSIREDGGQITTHRRIGGTRDDPTPYLDPSRPRSPLRAGLPARPVITQGALELTVAGLREELTDMRSAMKLDRMNRNPLNAPAVKENLARHTALLAAVNRAPQGATVYQREDKPVPVWAGKDSAAVPDRAVWFQRAVVKAQR